MTSVHLNVCNLFRNKINARQMSSCQSRFSLVLHCCARYLTMVVFMPTETLVVVATETSPAKFLELIPDDGTASYFLPHLLTCSQRHQVAWKHYWSQLKEDLTVRKMKVDWNGVTSVVKWQSQHHQFTPVWAHVPHPRRQAGFLVLGCSSCPLLRLLLLFLFLEPLLVLLAVLARTVSHVHTWSFVVLSWQTYFPSDDIKCVILHNQNRFFNKEKLVPGKTRRRKISHCIILLVL